MKTTVLPAIARIAARLFGVADAHLRRQPFDAAAIVRLAEIVVQAFDHGIADLIERIHVLFGLLVVLGELEASLVEGIPSAVTARQSHRGSLADMANAERVDEPLQRDIAPRRDGAEQITHRCFAEPFDLFEPDFLVAFLQRENIGRLLDPFALVEQFDLLLAESVDIEGAARHEMLEMLDGLERTGKLASAMHARALGAAGDSFAHHFGMQRARTLFGKLERLRAALACPLPRREPAE